jgi:hypothetical protein
MSIEERAAQWSKDRIREEIQDRRDSLANYTREVEERSNEWNRLDRPPQPVPFRNPFLEEMAALRKEIEFLKNLL